MPAPPPTHPPARPPSRPPALNDLRPFPRPPSSNRPECQGNTPATTTTPAFVHALFSPRPKARYPVSTVIAGIPASVFQYVLIFMPDRLKDYVALLTNAGGNAVASHQRVAAAGP